MRRYDMQPFINRGGDVDVKPQQSESGKWVRWSEIETLLNALAVVLKHAAELER